MRRRVKSHRRERLDGRKEEKGLKPQERKTGDEER